MLERFRRAASVTVRPQIWRSSLAHEYAQTAMVRQAQPASHAFSHATIRLYPHLREVSRAQVTQRFIDVCTRG